MRESPALLSVERVGIRHVGAASWTPHEVTFELAPGEVVLLLGPSGSGKSSLVLALNGLIPHAVPAELRGVVRVAGSSTTERTVAELSTSVGMVFQDPDSQIVTGTVLDEVCFGPENLLVPRADVLARAESALRRVGLWDRRDENPDLLSGGGRQRLAIACALALESPVIVLDEPTANLDPVGIEEVYAALRELVADGTRSIVLVEHNLDACIDVVDRVVVIDREGRPVVQGPVGEVLRERADDLLALGVWLPVATMAAIRLRDAGVAVDPLPLTPSQLAASLDAIAALPEPRTPEPPPSGGVPIVTVSDLSIARRARGEHRGILHGVSLEVAEGDFLALVGANGAGKTTLLQAIAGVRRPPKGRIRVAGLDPATAEVRTLAGRVGFVFQNPEHQFVRHTVAEELAHGLEIQGLPRGEVAARVDRMLERFGLGQHRDVNPFLLSGGQKRRLSVGSALIAGAPVLALDEPTFGQDRERAADLLDLLADVNANGTTVIVVTHDMQLVADYATRVAVLAGGRLLGTGPTADVLAGPLLEQAGLRPPPLVHATRALAAHPTWHAVTRLRDLPTAVAR